MKNRSLILYVASRGVSVLALQVASTLVVLRMLELGGGPRELGLLGLVATVAAIATSYPTGLGVDHWPRRISILSAQGLLALLSLAAGLFKGAVPLLYILAGVLAILRNFRSISQFAVFGDLLKGRPDRQLWINRSTLQWQLAMIIGPLGGAFLFKRLQFQASFTVVAALFALGFLFQTVFLRELPDVVADACVEKFGLKSALLHVLKNETLATTLSLDFLVVIFAGASTLAPFLLQSHPDPKYFAILRSAMPAGVMCSTCFLRGRSFPSRWRKLFFFAVVLFSTAQYSVAMGTTMLSVFLPLFLAGFFDGFSVSIREGFLQSETPAAMKGRIYSLNSFLVNASDELSEWESGIASHALGLRGAIRFGAGTALLATSSLGLYQMKKGRRSSITNFNYIDKTN